MNIVRTSVVLVAEDRAAVCERMRMLLGTDPQVEFRIPGSDLEVVAFPGFSILSGPATSLSPVRDLKATIFVTELTSTESTLWRTGWTNEGSLGAGGSLLARDPEGNLFEFIEERSVVPSPPA